MKIVQRQLPDINKFQQLPTEYDNYGRFGITTNGSFFVCGIHSSHASNTKIGGYWACDLANNILYLSPRGNSLDFKELCEYILREGKLQEIIKISGVKQ